LSKGRLPVFRPVAFAPEGVKLFHAWSPAPGRLSMAYLSFPDADPNEDPEGRAFVLGLHVDVLMWLMFGNLSEPPGEDWVFSEPPPKSRQGSCGVRSTEVLQ